MDYNYWITFTTIGFAIIIRNAPTHPPSLVATKDPEERNFCAALAEVLKIRSYVLLLIIFCGVDGCFISLADIISELFTAYNYDESDTSLFAGITVIFGVMSSLSVGIMLQRTSKYLITIRIVCFLTLICFILSAVILPMGHFYPTCAICAVLGMCLLPVIPCSMNFGQELTFPMAPPVTNGILLMFGQLGGGIFGIIGEVLCNISPYYALALFVSMVACGCISSIFLVEDLRRTNFAKIKSATEIDYRNEVLKKF